MVERLALSSQEAVQRGARALLVVPSLVWFGTFFIAPLVLVVVHSFGRMDLVTFEMRFGWTLQNYRNILDPIYFKTLLRSLALSTSTTILCALVGLPLAYFISRQEERWQRVLLLLVIVPFWTSFVVRIYAMVNALENAGPCNLYDALRALRRSAEADC